jgi:hypothetical protein
LGLSTGDKTAGQSDDGQKAPRRTKEGSLRMRFEAGIHGGSGFLGFLGFIEDGLSGTRIQPLCRFVTEKSRLDREEAEWMREKCCAKT